MIDAVNSIPFSDIAPAVASTPHSRKMMGVLLALFPGEDARPFIAPQCMSPDFAEILWRWGDESDFYAIARAGLLPTEKLYEYADLAEKFSEPLKTLQFEQWTRRIPPA